MSGDRQQLLQPLDRLAGLIRRFLMLRGLAWLVSLLVVAFWAALAVDWLYFQVYRQELPIAFRQLLQFAAVLSSVLLLARFVLLLIFRPLSRIGLALVLERRFPQLHDGLITAIEQLQTSPTTGTTLHNAMLDRTVRETSERLKNITLSDALDGPALRRTLGIAGVAAASVLALAVVSPAAVTRFNRAFVQLQDQYWQRVHALQVEVLAVPNERPVLFVNDVYRHPRGSDLVLRLTSTPGSPVPAVATIRTQGGVRGRTRETLLPNDAGIFRYSMPDVTESLSLTITAGDWVTARPLRVEVVDPPQIAGITLACRYPAYTGLNQDLVAGRVRTPLLSSLIELPAETDFLVEVRTNKPLTAVHVRGARFDLDWQIELPGAATADTTVTAAGSLVVSATSKSPDGNALGTADLAGAPVALPDGNGFVIPLQMGCGPLADDQRFDSWPLRLEPAGELKIDLEDNDGVYSPQSSRLTFRSIPDQPPVVETTRYAIGAAITRRARIPLRGVLEDDYGVVRAEFRYGVDADELKDSRALGVPPQNDQRLPLGAAGAGEYFEVVPLALNEGQRLNLAIMAVDGNDITGPGVTSGPVHQFQIVSPEELLTTIYQRELNLRRRFEQLLEDLTKARLDVSSHQQKWRELPAGESRPAVVACSERTLFAVRQAGTETSALADAFEQLRDELVNNAVDTRETLDRLNGRVIAPLRAAVETQFASTDRAVMALQAALQGETDVAVPLRETGERIDALMARLQLILNEMQRLETFQEAIELLKAIMAEQEKVLNQTREEKKKAAVRGLGLE